MKLINQSVFADKHLISSASLAFQRKQTFSEGDLSIISNPFPLCVIQNVFEERFLKNVKVSLLSQSFSKRSNDLYSFQQSGDLVRCQDPILAQYRDIIYSQEMIAFVSNMVGIPLSSTRIDLAGQQYFPGDYLLCHDDQLDSRKIAFICYLVEPQEWDELDGGSLDLFASDEAGQPTDQIKYRYFPKWNNFAFFEVTDRSFHQVAENVSRLGRVRISIAGWYHAEAFASQESDVKLSSNDNAVQSVVETMGIEDAVALPNETLDAGAELLYWINPFYLESSNYSAICEHFIENSSISLGNFLQPDRYDELQKEFNNSSDLKELYQPLHCRYGVVDESMHRLCKRFLKFMRSTAFTVFIANLFKDCFDSFKLEGSSAKYFQHRSFTLANDNDATCRNLLDVDYFLFPRDVEWNREWGGVTFYTADNESLLEVLPCANSLSLVYTSDDDGAVYQFIKYVNHRCPSGFLKCSLNYTVS